MPIHSVLCIAGSDSAGAAGIQADLKTLSALGVHGLTAITAITAQSTHAVSAIRVLPAAAIMEQLDAIFSDFPIHAVKIGMLGNAGNVSAVAGWLGEHRPSNIVLDPVLLSSSGRAMLSAAGRKALQRVLLPLVDVLTPNVPEACALLGREINSTIQMQQAARDLMRLGPRAVLLKGGHLVDRRSSDKVHDYFVDAAGTMKFSHGRRNFDARGTGCTLASAIAAGLADKLTLRQAVRRAEQYVQTCISGAFAAGSANKRLLAHTLKSPRLR